MTKILVWHDFWHIAKLWFGVTEEAAEWSHDWCSEYDFLSVYSGGSRYLDDLCDGIRQDVTDGIADDTELRVLNALDEVL